MRVGTAAKQAWDVAVILLLGLVYVAWLTVQTVIAHMVRPLRALRPTIDSGQVEPVERR